MATYEFSATRKALQLSKLEPEGVEFVPQTLEERSFFAFAVRAVFAPCQSRLPIHHLHAANFSIFLATNNLFQTHLLNRPYGLCSRILGGSTPGACRIFFSEG